MELMDIAPADENFVGITVKGVYGDAFTNTARGSQGNSPAATTSAQLDDHA